jgi:hypothetical protein
MALPDIFLLPVTDEVIKRINQLTPTTNGSEMGNNDRSSNAGTLFRYI